MHLNEHQTLQHFNEKHERTVYFPGLLTPCLKILTFLCSPILNSYVKILFQPQSIPQKDLPETRLQDLTCPCPFPSERYWDSGKSVLSLVASLLDFIKQFWWYFLGSNTDESAQSRENIGQEEKSKDKKCQGHHHSKAVEEPRYFF